MFFRSYADVHYGKRLPDQPFPAPVLRQLKVLRQKAYRGRRHAGLVLEQNFGVMVRKSRYFMPIQEFVPEENHLVRDSILAILSSDPRGDDLMKMYDSHKRSTILAENVEAELYNRGFAAGSGYQDLDVHGQRAEEYVLRCADEYVKNQSNLNVISWEDVASLPGDPNAWLWFLWPYKG